MMAAARYIHLDPETATRIRAKVHPSLTVERKLEDVIVDVAKAKYERARNRLLRTQGVTVQAWALLDEPDRAPWVKHVERALRAIGAVQC